MSAYIGVLGECLVDVVESDTSGPQSYVGGSPFNVAVGLSRLAHPVVFVGRHGSDDYGRMIARSLKAQGVTSLLAADGAATSVATATLDPTGQASYEFHLDWSLPPVAELSRLFHELPAPAGFVGGAAAEAGPGSAITAGLARENASSVAAQERSAESGDRVLGPYVEHLHTGSIAAMIEPGAAVVADVVAHARERVTISYDPNYRPSIVPDRESARAQAESLIGLADVVQASADDLDLLYPERTYQETMRAWLELGPAIVTITRGASGAMSQARNGFVDQDSFKVDVADTVGAGDSFMAATLSELRDRGLLGAANRQALKNISREALAGVVETAARAAAITSSRWGAQPPTRADLNQKNAESANS